MFKLRLNKENYYIIMYLLINFSLNLDNIIFLKKCIIKFQLKLN